MTDAGWAERMVKFLESVMPLPVHKRRDALLKLSALLGAIREAEHARAIRLVKAAQRYTDRQAGLCGEEVEGDCEGD